MSGISNNVLSWTGGVDGQLVHNTHALCQLLKLNSQPIEYIEKIFNHTRIIDTDVISKPNCGSVPNPYYIGLFEEIDGIVPMRVSMLKLVSTLEENFNNLDNKPNFFESKNPILFLLVLISISESLLQDTSLRIQSYAQMYDQFRLFNQSVPAIAPNDVIDMQSKILELYWSFAGHEYGKNQEFLNIYNNSKRKHSSVGANESNSQNANLEPSKKQTLNLTIS